jgi:hypothetical protein
LSASTLDYLELGEVGTFAVHPDEEASDVRVVEREMPQAMTAPAQDGEVFLPVVGSVPVDVVHVESLATAQGASTASTAMFGLLPGGEPTLSVEGPDVSGANDLSGELGLSSVQPDGVGVTDLPMLLAMAQSFHSWLVAGDTEALGLLTLTPGLLVGSQSVQTLLALLLPWDRDAFGTAGATASRLPAHLGDGVLADAEDSGRLSLGARLCVDTHDGRDVNRLIFGHGVIVDATDSPCHTGSGIHVDARRN